MLKRKREFICNFKEREKIRKETFKALNWVFTRWGVINVILLSVAKLCFSLELLVLQFGLCNTALQAERAN
jgi:hypothetical protein